MTCPTARHDPGQVRNQASLQTITYEVILNYA